MLDLNLPPIDAKLKKAEGKLWIFDGIRKKFVVLTPEEWVRQHFIQYLIIHRLYPRTLIRVEGGLTVHQLQKRADIVVFDRAGQPWMVIECKAPDVSLNDETVFQAALYNRTLQAPYLVVTNGHVHAYFQVDWSAQSTTRLADMPPYL